MFTPTKRLSRDAKEALIQKLDTRGEVARVRASGLPVSVDILSTAGDLLVGADIHFVVENRDPRDKHGWVGVYFSDSPLTSPSYNHIYVYDRNANISPEEQLRRMDDGVSPFGRLSRRDYSFFARLAGVRGDGPEPNGVPDDASVMTQRCVERWRGGGHSHGYVSLREFVRLKLLNNDTIAEAAKAKLKGRDPIEDFLSKYYDGDDITLDDNTRVIFWFDN